jgi:rod shape-determining protein MreD
MKYLFWLVVVFFAFILQSSISILNVFPNLTVVLVSFAGIRKGEVNGMLLGSVIGMVEDSLSGTLLGPHLLSKGLIGYLSASLYRKYFVWTPLLGLITIIFITFIDGFVVFISKGFFDKFPVSFGNAAFTILIQSLINAPLGMLLKPREYSKLEKTQAG